MRRFLFGTTKRRIISAAVLLCAVGGVFALWALVLRPTPFFSSAITRSKNFPLYVPTKLPPTLKLERNSVSSNAADVVLFRADDAQGGKTLNFSVEARPPKFDYTTFYTHILSDTYQFSTPSGQAAIGKGENLIIGSLLTDKTWVLMSGDASHFSSDDLKTTLSSLEQVK